MIPVRLNAREVRELNEQVERSGLSREESVSYTHLKEQVAVTYENGTTVPVPEQITDTKGYAVSPELPYGSYVVV